MRACHFSDTHDVHRDLDEIVPQDIDILFFTGDLTYKGAEWELNILLEHFIRLKQRIPYIVGCLGNHELGAEGKEDEWKMRFANIGIILLDHESIEIEGIKIFGSPYSPWFFDWAYSYYNPKMGNQQDDEQKSATEVWASIPQDTQILLTHGPPDGILDACKNGNVGCSGLLKRIKELKHLIYHMFGHIHGAHGVEVVDGVTFINSCIMDEKYKLTQKPHCFDLVL